VTGHVFARGLAFEVARGTGKEAELIDERGHLLGHRDGDRFAGVAALDVDDLARPGFHGVGDLQQRALPVGRRNVAPALECRRRGRHRRVNIGRRG
jgi:hypothetical protein